MVNNEYAKWATGFSGCDGGNLKGSIWLCGIEFGGGHTEKNLVFDAVDTPTYVGEPHYSREQFIKYQYCWKAVKLLAELADRDKGDYTSFFKEESCFDRDSDYFELNLYPIGFKSTSHARWADWLVRKTGLANKQQYLDWWFEHRFPALRKWLLDYSPSLVLCTGKTYAPQFQSAFGSNNEKVITEEVAGKRKQVLHNKC